MNFSRVFWDIYGLIRMSSHRFLREGLDVSCLPFERIPGYYTKILCQRRITELHTDGIWETTIPTENFYLEPEFRCCESELRSRRLKGRWSIKKQANIASQVEFFERDIIEVLEDGLPYEQSEYLVTLSRFLVGKSSNTANSDSRERVMKMINDLAYCLYQKCEYRRFSFNNHLLNNLRALTWANFLNENSENFEKSSGLYFFYLEKLLDDQCWLAEGSSSYHLLVTVWTLEIVSLLSTKSQLMVENICAKMVEHCDVFIINDNEMVLKGDVCPDMTVEMVLKDFNRLSEHLRIRSRKSEPENSNASTEYITLKHGDKRVICSLLPSSRGQRPHHGHMDSRHIDLIQNGYPVVINSGRHCYSSDCDLQDLQRSIFHHNGLHNANHVQPIFRRSGYWLPSFLNGENKVRIIDDNCIHISEAGLGTNRSEFNRKIRFLANGTLEVCDDLNNLGSHKDGALLFYIFDPSLKISKLATNSIAYSSNNVSGTIEVVGAFKRISFQETTIISKNYGHTIQAPVLKILIGSLGKQQLKLVFK